MKINFFLFRHFIASGSQDGIMAIYALETGECLCQKQLFGRIEVVKAKDDILATAHFGKDYDMGCITVRRIVSPNDLPVIFSIYQVRKFFLLIFLVNFVLVRNWSYCPEGVDIVVHVVRNCPSCPKLSM